MHGPERVSEKVVSGVWLVGLGVMLATGRWWPGLMFVGGVAELVRGALTPESRQTAFRSGAALLLFGAWCLMRFSVPLMLVGLGVWTIIAAFSTAAPPAPLEKPYVDQRLD